MDLDGDYLIIGSGIAALRAAASLAGAGDVLILTKGGPREGNTGYAQGGIAAAVGPDDSPASHLRDTLAAGDGLCDERAVAVLVEEGPRYVRELIDWGARFDRAADGSPALAIEGAHSVRRVLHARDATGREIGRVLWTRVSPMSNVRVIDYARAVSVIVEDGRCAGVRFLQEDGAVAVARARGTLLATGGAGRVYRETTNPSVATGDGVAIAYLAGAAVADLEFVQFHPTALDVSGQPRFLLSEALRGEGARLVNADGEPFMMRYDPAGDLAPRDRVSRGIAREAQRTGKPVYLTLAHLDPSFVHERFPLISAACRRGWSRSRDRSDSGRSRGALRDGGRRDGPRWPHDDSGPLPPEKWRARVSTAQTVLRAIRCSRAWCSVLVQALQCAGRPNSRLTQLQCEASRRPRPGRTGKAPSPFGRDRLTRGSRCGI